MQTDNNKKDYKTVLENDGVLAQPTSGCSMLPMLRQNRDTVIIGKITSPLKNNDVVFYQRKTGEYVLHRIVKIENNGYVIRGDNCYYNECDITDDNILGILNGFYRDEKYIDCKTSTGYKFYVFAVRSTYYLRLILMKLRIFLSKIKKKITKK